MRETEVDKISRSSQLDEVIQATLDLSLAHVPKDRLGDLHASLMAQIPGFDKLYSLKDQASPS